MKKIVIAIFAVCVITSPVVSLTRGNLETESRRALRDNPSDTARYRIADTILDDFLNEAQREIVSFTWCLETSTAITLVANTTFYALPNDFIAINPAGGVRYENASGDTTLVAETSRRKIYEDNANWEDETGPPNEYFLHQDSDADPLDMAVSPIPTSASTGTLTVQYFYQATDMSADTDVPFEGFRHLYPYHILIAYHAIARIKLIEGKPEEAQLYISLYQNGLLAMQDRLQQMPNYFPTGRAYTPTRK